MKSLSLVVLGLVIGLMIESRRSQPVEKADCAPPAHVAAQESYLRWRFMNSTPINWFISQNTENGL
jgi:hypothetical protein